MLAAASPVRPGTAASIRPAVPQPDAGSPISTGAPWPHVLSAPDGAQLHTTLILPHATTPPAHGPASPEDVAAQRVDGPESGVLEEGVACAHPLPRRAAPVARGVQIRRRRAVLVRSALPRAALYSSHVTLAGRSGRTLLATAVWLAKRVVCVHHRPDYLQEISRVQLFSFLSFEAGVACRCDEQPALYTDTGCCSAVH